MTEAIYSHTEILLEVRRRIFGHLSDVRQLLLDVDRTPAVVFPSIHRDNQAFFYEFIELIDKALGKPK